MPGAPDAAFHTIWPLPAHLSEATESENEAYRARENGNRGPAPCGTGRAANVNPVTVSTSKHLADYVQAMREDLLAHPTEWEKGTLERFLDAPSGYLDGRTDTPEPSWTTSPSRSSSRPGYE